MSRTLAQILSAGGPDPAWLAAALTKADFGTMLTPQRRSVTQSSSPITKLSALSTPIPPMRVGAVAKFIAGGMEVFSGWGVAKGSFAVDVPATGLTVGTGNAQIRITPRPGYTVRYAQFNPGSVATTGPTYYNASFTRTIYASLKGKVCEIWTALGTTAASAVAAQTASAVIADLLANSDVAASCFVDVGTGTGAGNVAILTPSDLVAFRPNIGAASAVGAADPAYAAPGSFVLSQDGNLMFTVTTWTSATFEYDAAPAMALENEYESSAV